MRDSTKILSDNKVVYHEELVDPDAQRIEDEYADYIIGGYLHCLGLLVDYKGTKDLGVLSHMIRKSVYTLWHLNDGIEQSIVLKYVIKAASELGFSDAKNYVEGIVFRCFEGDIDMSYIYRKRYVLFKQSAFSLTINERVAISSKLTAKAKRDGTIDAIRGAVDSLIEVGGYISKADIVEALDGVSMRTLDRYWGYVVDAVRANNLYICGYSDDRGLRSQGSLSCIYSAGLDIHYIDRDIINKSRVSKKSALSRPTVDKHWVSVADDFLELNAKLYD
jgi:hypothetical protein